MIQRILIFISLIGFSVAPPPGEPDKKNIDLYYNIGSAPCQAVRLTAKYLGIELNLKRVNLLKGEQMKAEFLEINPLHKVPVLIDDEFNVKESHVIIMYLAEKYGKHTNLYPEDINKHTIVKERLFYDSNTLWQSFGDAYFPLILERIPFTPEQKEKLDEAVKLVESWLGENEYIAGDQLTVADFSFLASITIIDATDYDISTNKYPNINTWLDKVKSVFSEADYNEANGDGVEAYRNFFKTKTKN